MRDLVRKEIDKLLRDDIIEKVEGPTPWVSPIVPIVKKTGEIRLCLDLRRVNEGITRQRYPLPVFTELLDKVKGAKYFSKLDIREAFNQIELEENT